MSQTRGVDPQALENPPSWWKWILSGAWKSGPPIVSILMRSATITSDTEMEQARIDADVLVLPQVVGSDIRDWKTYDGPVATGYAAMTAALEALPCPVQRIRRCPPPAPVTEEAPEPTAASPSPRR